MTEADAVADRQPLGRTDESLPAVRCRSHVQRRVDLRDGVATPAQAAQLRGNDPGVVEHQQIAGVEQRWQIADDPVRQRSAWLDDQHSRCIARLGWTQRDPVVGQIEIEEVDAHGLLVRGRCS